MFDDKKHKISDCPELVSVVVRYHQKGEIAFLYEALESILNQSYSEIEIIICTQNIEEEKQLQISSFLQNKISKLSDKDRRFFKIYNQCCDAGEDLRARLFTKGIDLSSGKYLAFLDYDDVVYKFAYATLVELLPKNDDVALVAAGVNRVIRIKSSGDAELTVSGEPFIKRQYSKHELFHHNVLPLHSYLIKKQSLQSISINDYLDKLWMFEDYALLLLLASRYNFELSYFEIPVGEYRFRPYLPNSTLQIKSDERVKEKWIKSYDIVESIKKEISVNMKISELSEIIHFERTHHFNSLSYDFYDF